MTIIVPNAASVYDAAASVPNSKNRWAWLGFISAPNSSGCVVWYAGTAASANPRPATRPNRLRPIADLLSLTLRRIRVFEVLMNWAESTLTPLGRQTDGGLGAMPMRG